jgi:hypothetical protein
VDLTMQAIAQSLNIEIHVTTNVFL